MTTPPDSDETTDLLEKCWAGDRNALRSLVDRDLEWIRGYVHRHLHGVVREHADTDDVVQEVLVRLLESGPGFVVESHAACRRVLARIVLNTLVCMARHYTARKRVPAEGQSQRRAMTDSVLYLDGDRPQKRMTQPGVRLIKEEDAEWVHLAIDLLDARDQEVLRLRDWEQLPFGEIGSRINLGEDGARKCYNQALVKMSNCLRRLRAGEVERALDALEQ